MSHQVSQLRHQTLKAYKQLLLARSQTFQNDIAALKYFRDAIRFEFEKNRDVVDQDKIQKLIQDAKEAADVLRKNVVQGIKKKDAQNRFELRITPQTELNDNDTIKRAGKGKTPQRQGGCGCG